MFDLQYQISNCAYVEHNVCKYKSGDFNFIDCGIYKCTSVDTQVHCVVVNEYQSPGNTFNAGFKQWNNDSHSDQQSVR